MDTEIEEPIEITRSSAKKNEGFPNGYDTVAKPKRQMSEKQKMALAKANEIRRIKQEAKKMLPQMQVVKEEKQESNLSKFFLPSIAILGTLGVLFTIVQKKPTIQPQPKEQIVNKEEPKQQVEIAQQPQPEPIVNYSQLQLNF